MRDSVRDKLDIALEDLGEQPVKNIAQPGAGLPHRRGRAAADPPRRPAVPDKPSIAVLPFANMSGDAEQEYFSDGITEDLITDLSKVSALFVIARNSSFTYKGRAVKVQEIGRELGVRFVLEGSIRKAGNRVRITAPARSMPRAAAICGPTGSTAISTDIFATQDEVVAEDRRARWRSSSRTVEAAAACAARGTSNVEAYESLAARAPAARPRHARDHRPGPARCTAGRSSSIRTSARTACRPGASPRCPTTSAPGRPIRRRRWTRRERWARRAIELRRAASRASHMALGNVLLWRRRSRRARWRSSTARSSSIPTMPRATPCWAWR